MTSDELDAKEQELAAQEAAWAREKKILESEKQMKEEKETLTTPKKKWTVSKLICIFLLLNFTIIEILTGWVTYQTVMLGIMYGMYMDFSPLISFIGAFIGEVTTYAIYSSKSKAENTQGGIVYDQAMAELQLSSNSSSNYNSNQAAG